MKSLSLGLGENTLYLLSQTAVVSRGGCIMVSATTPPTAVPAAAIGRHTVYDFAMMLLSILNDSKLGQTT